MYQAKQFLKKYIFVQRESLAEEDAEDANNSNNSRNNNRIGIMQEDFHSSNNKGCQLDFLHFR